MPQILTKIAVTHIGRPDATLLSIGSSRFLCAPSNSIWTGECRSRTGQASDLTLLKAHDSKAVMNDMKAERILTWYENPEMDPKSTYLACVRYFTMWAIFPRRHESL